MRSVGGWLWVCALVGLSVPTWAGAQDLADFDYENLSFRGFGAEWGYIFPTRVENAQSYGVRMDLGYLGPGLRIVPGVTYWSSRFKQAEVSELEDRVASLVETQTGAPPPTVDLGTIEWRDVALAVDAHVVWRVPFGVLTFAGLGVAAHMLNGEGAAIQGTFVEDLLDSVAAGFNFHVGVEYPIADRFRLYSQGRYEVLGDLQYTQVRVGGQLLIGGLVAGEEQRR